MTQPLRTILHLDLDAFFAAVEQLDDPDLRGKPVIVGGLTSRGVVATASYEARRFGVKSAMPMVFARRRCPNGVFVRPRFERYQEISAQVMEILSRVSPLVEAVSIDEAYVDITEQAPAPEQARALARRVKDEIRERIGLTGSAGVAPCKFVAKIASDAQKPDGLTVVPPEEVIAFLSPLSVGEIPGVGKVTEAHLRTLGFRTIGELAAAPRDLLHAHFGKFGPQLYDFARGIDPRPIVVEREAKSLGSESTFEQDQTERAALWNALRAHAERVAERLREQGLAARTITLKLRYGDFRSITRSQSLDAPAAKAEHLCEVASRLLEKTAAGRRPVRLIGLYAGSLEPLGEAGATDFFGLPFGEGAERD